jgi:hypothetical protein
MGGRGQIYLFQLFSTGFVDTDGKFTAVSTTPVTICHWSQFAADVIYTGGKFAIIVIDTRSKFVASVVDTGGAP